MRNYIFAIMYLLTPAICWCQYFYQIYPEKSSSSFKSIKLISNRIYTTQDKAGDFWDCSIVKQMDINGSIIWSKEFPNTNIGSSTFLIHKDTLYVGGNFKPGIGISIIHRMDLNGQNIDEYKYTDTTNTISGSLINFLDSDNKVIFFSGVAYVNGKTKAFIYLIDRKMKLKEMLIDSFVNSSSIWDAHLGPDSLLTCFIMESSIAAPRDRRRIEKYDKDLNLVWKYSPPDSLLWFGNSVKFHGNVLQDGNTFFTYYTFGNERSLPSFLLLDTISKKTVWQYDFPNIDNYGRYVLKTKQLKNGDILISGYYSNITQQPLIRDCPWLMRMDKNGNKIWEHSYAEILPNNQNKAGALWDAIELENGDLLACGFVTNNNKWDPLLIRTDADGCIDQGQANCLTVQIIDLMSGTVDEIGKQKISIFPNPASTYITIDAPTNSTFAIYSMSGQKMIHGVVDNDDIDISLLSAGLYLVRVVDATGYIFSQKLVKE